MIRTNAIAYLDINVIIAWIAWMRLCAIAPPEPPMREHERFRAHASDLPRAAARRHLEG
jgi:hypothetical protein